MSERYFTKRGTSLGTILLIGGITISTAACGSSKEHDTAVVQTDKSGTGPTVTYKYHSNGTREIIISRDGLSDDAATANTILEFCDGPDLVEESENNTPNDWPGGGLARTVSYPACKDGKLTPSDFSS